jgi:hypothetical protein
MVPARSGRSAFFANRIGFTVLISLFFDDILPEVIHIELEDIGIQFTLRRIWVQGRCVAELKLCLGIEHISKCQTQRI